MKYVFLQFEENAAECRSRCPRNFERLLAINLLLCDFSLKRISVLCHSTLSGVAKKTLWKRWIFINGQSEWEWTAFKSWIFWKTRSLISRNSIRYSPPLPPPPTTTITCRSNFRASSKALLVWSLDVENPKDSDVDVFGNWRLEESEKLDSWYSAMAEDTLLKIFFEWSKSL